MFIALDKQVHIYAVDTAAFYTDREHQIDQDTIHARVRKSQYEQELAIAQKYRDRKISQSSALSQLKKLYKNDDIFVVPNGEDMDEICGQIDGCKAQIRDGKKELRKEFEQFAGVRHLRPEAVCARNVISIFESFLTRTLQMKTNELSDSLVIVRVYFFEVFRDLVLNGFDVGGEHYVMLTASAGQIRTKKCVFIKESLLEQHRSTLMCGLTVDEINKRGGCNTNKFIAYLALCNSATDVWSDFDIDRSIVVDDMETVVRGTVDYIDDKTYSITRQDMDIPINHTDGCGMILPHLTSGKNTMVRLPWIKGLLAAFSFDEFVREANASGDWNYSIVKDIYGKAHDVLAEDIQVIFTKSQFKMWKYYDSWEQYKAYYKQYGCSAGICNMEEDVIESASIGYQMLQSLTDLTDAELRKLSSRTRYKLEHIATDRKTQLKCLGATPGNPYKTPAQEALLLYPELLQDPYYREELRNMKASIEKWAWAGKLDIFAKYLFVIPDLYAYCQYLFLGQESPVGLLADGEVYAAEFPDTDKLDCLRSPSLYREHPVRHNVHDNEVCRKWFSKRGIYTSCHDLISKYLMFDVDGDKLLVCAEKTLVDAAERHMEGIVPLYYDMRKAAPAQITNQSVYDGMVKAYTGGNIGPISNSISKIWNSKKPDIDTIKRLVYKNNEVIDYAKTLYKSIPPKDIQREITSATNGMLPHFFVYAKDKAEYQVLDCGDSPVDRLLTIVPRTRFDFRGQSGSRYDYRMLMDNPLLICTDDVLNIIAQYRDLSSSLKLAKCDEESNEYSFQYQQLRDSMFCLSSNSRYVVDAIILGIFKRSKSIRKKAFWGAFGDIALENLRINMAKAQQNTTLCHKCFSRFTDTNGFGICPVCGTANTGLVTQYCIDCGEAISVAPKHVATQVRCRHCYGEFRRMAYRISKQRINKFHSLE